jgi:hypothetical protein
LVREGEAAGFSGVEAGASPGSAADGSASAWSPDSEPETGKSEAATPKDSNPLDITMIGSFKVAIE